MKRQYIRPEVKINIYHGEIDFLDSATYNAGNNSHQKSADNGDQAGKYRNDAYDAGGTFVDEPQTGGFGSDNGPWETLW